LGSAALSIGPQNISLVTTPASLTVAENSGAIPIGIVAPSDANYAASQLSVMVTALPTDGTVLLSNGTTPVTVGERRKLDGCTADWARIQADTGQYRQQLELCLYRIRSRRQERHRQCDVDNRTQCDRTGEREARDAQSVWQVTPGQDWL
jgi:hypothetical protein